MDKQKSITRSKQLHQIGQDLIHRLEQVPCGLQHSQIEMQHQRKKAILSYLNASEEDWNNWQWQITHRIQTIEALTALLSLTSEQVNEIKTVSEHFRFAISPYYFSLIDWRSPENDPIAKMSLPDIRELEKKGVSDPSAEEYTNPAGRIVRRYPNRVIINITNCCASFCRHCQRKRIIGSQDHMISAAELDASVDYIQNHSEIHDVLVTGGDALTLSDAQLQQLLCRIRAIPHVKIIRLGSRMPVNLPKRITEDLVQILKQYAPIYINTQFNHPLEVTPEALNACKLLADSGIVLGNQMVLLRGINNDKYIVQCLNELLLDMRVRPYYIFHAKDVTGTMHFQTSITEGIDIYAHLWGNTSGLAIPRYIVSAPQGMGKIEITQDTRYKKVNGRFHLTTWEGIPVSVLDFPIEECEDDDRTALVIDN